MQRNTIWTVPILLLALLGPVFADEPKGVTVSLRVKWPGTSVLLEAAEFLVGLIACHKYCRHYLQTHHAFDPCCAYNLLCTLCRQARTQTPFGVS